MQRKINEIQQRFHHLSQLLFAFTTSYLPKEADNSQSNLKWSVADQALISRSVQGVYLSLGFKDMMLKVIKNQQIKALDILGLSLNNIDLWLRTVIQSFGINGLDLNNKLGFDLPIAFTRFGELDATDKKAISTIVNQRNICQLALENIQQAYPSITGEIRVWPRYFDTRMLLDKSEKKDYSKGIGLGYSIANTVSQVSYYYAHAWSDREIDYSELPTLEHSFWVLEDWKGAIITTNMRYNDAIVTALYNEAIECFEEII